MIVFYSTEAMFEPADKVYHAVLNQTINKIDIKNFEPGYTRAVFFKFALIKPDSYILNDSDETPIEESQKVLKVLVKFGKDNHREDGNAL